MAQPGCKGASNGALHAQCSTSAESSYTWEVVAGDDSDEAFLYVYSDLDGNDVESVSLTYTPGITLNSGASSTVSFSGGWLHQSGSGDGSSSISGGVISTSYSRASCNFKSGDGLICVITVDNNGVSIDCSEFAGGGGLIVGVIDIL
jgi:hypothetical protein